VSAAIRWAPSLLLSGSKRRPGIEGFLLSPPVIAGAVVAGIAISGHFLGAQQGVHRVEVADPGREIITGDEGTLTAIAFDRSGRVLPTVALTFASQKGFLTITNASTGAYKAGDKEGQDFVTATTADGVQGVTVVTVGPG
jgi:hypothetical protein